MRRSLLPLLKALADPTRIRILLLLKKYELTVNEVCAVLEMGQSRVSRHLKILLDANILSCRREGLCSYYSLERDGREAECFDALSPHLKDEQVPGDFLRADELLKARIERTREFFNTIAPQWDHLKKEIFGTLDINGFIVELLSECRCRTVADLGCGTGDLIDSVLAQKDFSGEMIGVDNSPAMIEVASRRFRDMHHKPELRIGSIEHLPMRDNEADCALLNCVLHHSPDPSQTICEINRALQLHTTLILVDFDRHENTNFSTDYGDLWLGFEKTTLFNWLHEGGFEVRRYDALSIRNNMALHIITSKKVRGMHDFKATA